MSEVKNELETETTPAPAKKQRLSNDDLYRNSTQYELWSFTQETLQDAKREANEKGVKISKERFKSAFENAKKEHPDAFEQFPDELNENMVSLLTLEEESTYLDFYIQNITTTCNF